jgi:hypothetical protein
MLIKKLSKLTLTSSIVMTVILSIVSINRVDVAASQVILLCAFALGLHGNRGSMLRLLSGLTIAFVIGRLAYLSLLESMAVTLLFIWWAGAYLTLARNKY